MTQALSAAELALSTALVEALNLEDVDAAAANPEAPLFGDHEAGWGLDSIDALEIALLVKQKYGIELRSDNDDDRRAFGSLRSLSQHIGSRVGVTG